MGKRVPPHAASGLQRAHDDARLDFVFGGMLDFCQRLTSRSENLRRTVRIPFALTVHNDPFWRKAAVQLVKRLVKSLLQPNGMTQSRRETVEGCLQSLCSADKIWNRTLR